MGRRHGPLQYLGRGRHREVYASVCGRFVYKLPVVETDRKDFCACESDSCVCYGLGDNDREARCSNEHGRGPSANGCRLARCKLTPSGILVMERVDEDAARGHRPFWTGYIDGAQVGFTQDGRLVAYDYGW